MLMHRGLDTDRRLVDFIASVFRETSFQQRIVLSPIVIFRFEYKDPLSIVTDQEERTRSIMRDDENLFQFYRRNDK